jgi:hypothetical protein
LAGTFRAHRRAGAAAYRTADNRAVPAAEGLAYCRPGRGAQAATERGLGIIGTTAERHPGNQQRAEQRNEFRRVASESGRYFHGETTLFLNEELKDRHKLNVSALESMTIEQFVTWSGL